MNNEHSPEAALAEAKRRIQYQANLLAQYGQALGRALEDNAALAKMVGQLDAAVQGTKAQWWWRLGLALRAAAGRALLKRRPPRYPYDGVPAIMAAFAEARKRDDIARQLHSPERLKAMADWEALPESAPATARAGAPPAISVVSAVFNKASALPEYLQAFTRQTCAGPLELVLVDDDSGDKSASLIETFSKEVAPAIPGLSVRLLRTVRNMGNCGARNRGLNVACGEILVIMDADCVVNPEFIEQHQQAHAAGCDICIGPMDIETKNRSVDNMWRLLREDPGAYEREMHLQYPQKKDAFLNCVTRNFSIARSFLEQSPLLQPLFDEDFAYSRRVGSGFGWEDIEMAYRCYLSRARIHFAEGAVSLHQSHPPAFDDGAKALRCIQNFRLLMEKHPDLMAVSPDWSVYTFRRIRHWLVQYEAADTPDAIAVAAMLETAGQDTPWRVAESVHQW